MKQRFSSLWLSSLPKVLIFLVIPVTVVLVVVVLVSQSIHHRDMRQMAGDRDLRAAIQTARVIENGLFRLQDNLYIAAEQIKSGSAQMQYLPWMQDFQKGVYTFDCAASNLQQLGRIGEPPDLKSTQVLCSLLADADGSGAAYRQVMQAEPVLWMSVGIDADQILIGGISLTPYLLAILPGGAPDTSQSLLIFNQNHEVIFSAGREPVADHEIYHPGVLAGLTGKSGTFFPQDHHEERIITYTPIQPTGWMLITEESWQDAGNSTLLTTQLIPLVLIPVLIFTMLGLLLLVYWVVYPLQKLARQAEQLNETNPSTLNEPVGGIREILDLQSVLRSLYLSWLEARHNLQEYIGGLTAGVETERKKLSRDLHDGLLQDLIAHKQNLHLRGAGEGETDAIQKIIDQVRGFTRGLRPPYLEDLGWVTAVRTYVMDFQQSAGIRVEVTVIGDERRLNTDVELTLFRVVQEALNNIRKHASAAGAVISIRFLDDVLRLEIRDDGAGFHLPERLDRLAAAGHFGLLGMRERIEIAQGTMEIATAPGKGTRIIVKIPSGIAAATPE